MQLIWNSINFYDVYTYPLLCSDDCRQAAAACVIQADSAAARRRSWYSRSESAAVPIGVKRISSYIELSAHTAGQGCRCYSGLQSAFCTAVQRRFVKTVVRYGFLCPPGQTGKQSHCVFIYLSSVRLLSNWWTRCFENKRTNSLLWCKLAHVFQGTEHETINYVEFRRSYVKVTDLEPWWRHLAWTLWVDVAFPVQSRLTGLIIWKFHQVHRTLYNATLHWTRLQYCKLADFWPHISNVWYPFKIMGIKTYFLPLSAKYFKLISRRAVVEFYLYPTVSTVLIHSVKPELTE